MSASSSSIHAFICSSPKTRGSGRGGHRPAAAPEETVEARAVVPWAATQWRLQSRSASPWLLTLAGNELRRKAPPACKEFAFLLENCSCARRDRSRSPRRLTRKTAPIRDEITVSSSLQGVISARQELQFSADAHRKTPCSHNRIGEPPQRAGRQGSGFRCPRNALRRVSPLG